MNMDMRTPLMEAVLARRAFRALVEHGQKAAFRILLDVHDQHGEDVYCVVYDLFIDLAADWQAEP